MHVLLQLTQLSMVQAAAARVLVLWQSNEVDKIQQFQ